MSVLLIHILIFFYIRANAVAEGQGFLLYGYVDVRVDYDNCLCNHQLSVQIGRHIWQQPLNWRSYAFKVRQNSLNSRVGTLSLDIYRGEELVKNLWREYFVIEPWGAHRLDIRTVNDERLFCACKQSKAEDFALVKVVSGDIVRFTRSASYSRNYSFSSPLCHCQCHCKCKEEDEDEEMMTPLLMVLPANGKKFKPKANKQASLLHCLIFLFGIAQLMLRLLQSRINIRKFGERGVGGGGGGSGGVGGGGGAMVEGGEGRRNWQMSSYGNAMKSSSKMRMKNGVLVSGEGTYEEAWAWADAADHHLDDVDCCFYFNSTATQTHTKRLFASAASASSEGEGGPWNRDSFGRLIRLSTIPH